ncbi:MAG: glucose-1-phosphate thymidylyltransferase [Thermoplasmata archaeon]|nr:glucose-1-phosphate thymidylyltransferase [Thermoplasmata archaeon]
MKGLILAGGHGTRLRPLTFTGNKHMIPIANEPILFHGLRNLADAGIREVAIILGPIQEGIQEGVGDGSRFGLHVTYIHQGEPKGLAHAVLCARSFLGEDPFVMYLGDNLLQAGVLPFLAAYEREHPDAVVAATPVANPVQYGIVELDGDRIVSIEEKPAHPKSNLALIGVYLFTASIHPVIARLQPSRRGELEITEAIWNLLQTGARVHPLRLEGWWKDTGLPADLLDANEKVLDSLPEHRMRREGTISPRATVRGRVSIEGGSVVEDGATIEGPAMLGKNVRIGAGSHVGPGSTLGDGVQLAGASVRRSILLEGARVEGPVRIADSLVGRRVLISARHPSPEEVTLVIGDAAQIRL